MASRVVTESATLAIPDGAPSRIAVIADTHSKPHDDAERHLAAIAPVAILHAGDIGDVGVLDRFGAIAPLFAIRGNIDAHGLPDEITLDVTAGDRDVLRIFLVHIGLAGTRLRSEVARRARSERAALVVCGLSHIPFIGRERDLAV